MAGSEEDAFVKQQLRIHANMVQKRQPEESMMAEVCDMFTPELFRRPNNTGSQLEWNRDRWDGYPQLALHTWSKGIPGNMIYDGNTQWLNMRINVRTLMNDPEIKKYCEEKTEQVFWATRRTNFYSVNPQFCRYAGAIGGYMFPVVDRARRSVEFLLEDPWFVWVERDIFGRISRIHREIDKSIQSLADEFGKESLHKTRLQAFKGSGNPLKEITVLHCISKNPNYDAESLDASRAPYLSCYIDKGTRKAIEIKGTTYMPVDWCVERAPRSAYPLTPSMFALVDAYGGDTLCKSLFNVALESADPEMKVAESLWNQYVGGPGEHTQISDPAADILEQVHKQFNWPIPDRERELLNNKTDWWFSVEYWRLLSSIQGQMPTAYHIQQLAAEKATLLGPQVGTYTRQVLDPATDIISQEEEQYDPVPMPDILIQHMMESAARELERLGYTVTEEQALEYAQKAPMAMLEAKYTGVLTAVQSQVVHARKYGEGLQAMQMIDSLWPDAKYVIDQYPMTRNILETANWSQKDLRDRDEWQQIVDGMQEREDLMAQGEQEAQSAKAYKQMIKAPEKGSPAEAA